MKQNNKLMGDRVGGWWEPIRAAVWRFAGASSTTDPSALATQQVSTSDAEQTGLALPMPQKVIITYISRQSVHRRKLVPEDHDGLVAALKELVARKGDSWELEILQAEKMTKDEQVQAAARTTVCFRPSCMALV